MDALLIAQSATEMADATEILGDLAPPIQIALFLGALSFFTAMLVSVTAFTRIVIVLSFVRRALATQEIPPNPVLLGLSVFLTLFVMAPTIETINIKGVEPFLAWQNAKDDESVPKFEYADLWEVMSTELKTFMLGNTRPADLQLFAELAGSDSESESEFDSQFEMNYVEQEIPLQVVIPAFIISELKTAFIMGFCLYIPFLLIDLVVSTILMSLGMMMMPPVVVSTPCKLLLFVLVDGWQLLTRALVSSFHLA